MFTLFDRQEELEEDRQELSVWSKVWHGMQLHSLYSTFLLLQQRKQWDEKRVKYKKEKKMRSNKGIDQQESIWDSPRNKILPTSTQQNLVTWYALKEYELVREDRRRERTSRTPGKETNWSQSPPLCLFSFGHRIRSYILFFLLPDATLWKQGCRAIYSLSLSLLKFLGVSRQIQYLTLLLWVEAESYFPLKMKRVGWNELMLFSLSFLFISSSSSSLHLFPLLVPFTSCLFMSLNDHSFLLFATLLSSLTQLSFWSSLSFLFFHVSSCSFPSSSSTSEVRIIVFASYFPSCFFTHVLQLYSYALSVLLQLLILFASSCLSSSPKFQVFLQNKKRKEEEENLTLNPGLTKKCSLCRSSFLLLFCYFSVCLKITSSQPKCSVETERHSSSTLISFSFWRHSMSLEEGRGKWNNLIPCTWSKTRW